MGGVLGALETIQVTKPAGAKEEGDSVMAKKGSKKKKGKKKGGKHGGYMSVY